MTIEWEPVHLGSAVITGILEGHYGRLLAYGHECGQPFAAVVGTDLTVQTLNLPGASPVVAAAVSEAFEFVIDAAPPQMIVGGGLLNMPFEPVDYVDVGDVVRLWPVCGDEDPQVITMDATGRLRVVDPNEEIPEGRGLWVEAQDVAAAPLLVGQGEVSAYVAGNLRGGQGASGEQVWFCDFYDGWTRLDVSPQPDEWTDIRSGSTVVVAGHRGLRPVMFDERGEAVDGPDVPLDPSHPKVFVAEAGVRTVLAIQSSEAGPQLWLHTGETWMVNPLPPGRLKGARLTSKARDESYSSWDSHLWVLVGDRVWHSGDL